MELKDPESNDIKFEIKDNVLKDIVNAKLCSFNMDNLDKLNDKTVQRILETEFFIQYSNKRIGENIDEIKSNLISITNLDKSDIVTCSRKTIYNDKVLKKYIENCSKMETDYFNSKELKKLQNSYDDLLNLYNKLLVNIIDIHDLKSQIKELNKEIFNLYEEKNNLYECLVEKDKEIYELKMKLKSNNITIFPTQK